MKIGIQEAKDSSAMIRNGNFLFEKQTGFKRYLLSSLPEEIEKNHPALTERELFQQVWTELKKF